MTDDVPDYATWLPVIGRSLAYLCLDAARNHEPDKYREVLNKVKFLEGLGVPTKDAAEAAGSSAESVRVTRYKKSKAKRNGKGTGKQARTNKR